MLSLVFDFCYYATFVIVPIVVFLLVNDDEKFHSKGGFLYLVKYIFGGRAIKKQQKKIKITKTYDGMERFEKPKTIKIETQTESFSLNAVDQEANQLSIKITLCDDHISESSICLRIGQSTYISPDEGGVTRKHISGYQWECNGLKVEILEPFKRYRLIYNGFLRNISPESNRKIEHVSFRFTWNCCSKPNLSLADDHVNLLAKSLAKATWRDGSWLKLLGDEKSVVQFGALKGFIQGENIPGTNLNMACVRKKTKGTSETIALNKSLTVFAATVNGYLLHLGVKFLKNGCEELKFGHVLTTSGSVFPVKNCDLDLSKEGSSVSEKITIHVEVEKKMFKVVLTMNNNSIAEITNDNFRGFKSRNISAECTVNNHRGYAILQCWQSHEGNGLKRPTPILREIKPETVPEVIVTPIGSEESKILELSGGKGHSLSLMKSLESEEISIPDGFIVTTLALQKQIETSFNLRKSLLLLEDIALEREKGDLKDACNATVELFQEHPITPTVQQYIIDELMKFRRKHDKEVLPYLRWAVRSSAVGEDSEEHSSAGQNETFLGSQTDKDVLLKVRKCWASLFSYQSVMYRKQHGTPIRSAMAVVVQNMVPAEVSGVLFTCHPSNSDTSKMVITSNFGLGETVVSGESEPDTITLSKTYEGNVSLESVNLGSKIHSLVMGRYGIHKHSGDDNSDRQTLTETQALQLGRLGVTLEEAFGSPRDIEWAFFKDHLYILQSRPVTTLDQWSDEELTHEFDSPHVSNDTFYTRANIGEVSPFPLTALTYSTLIDGVEKGCQMCVFQTYDPFVSISFRYSHHFCMIELLSGFYTKPMKDISVFNHMVDLAVFGRPVLTEEINEKALARYGPLVGFKKVKELLVMISNNLRAKKLVKNIIQQELNVVINLDERDSIINIFEKIDKEIPKIIYINYTHCQISSLSVFCSFLALNLLMRGDKEIKMEHYNDLATLLSRCNDVLSADVPAKLEEMAGIIRKSNKVKQFLEVETDRGVEWLKNNCVEAYNLLEKFLELHGHRLLGEMELSFDTWAMDPSAVIKMLKINCKFPTVDKERMTFSEDIVKDLKSPMTNTTKKIVRFLMYRYRKTVGYRETSKSTLIKATNKFRMAYRVLAQKMVKEGLIPSETLIYHLTQYELWQVINRKNPSLISKAARRQRLYPTWNKLRFPEVMYDIPVPEVEDEENLERLETDVCCSGTPVSCGEVTARAAVITSLDEVHLLRQGDVLITRSTDIGWSPYFPMISGIVTELGGLVSHGAVVAREYGLPCLVGAQNATKIFQTGDQVFLSGKKGVIKLLSR